MTQVIRNRMSKSNATEVISVLYLIAAIVSTGVTPNWLTVVLYIFAAENFIESIIWGAMFRAKGEITL